MSVVLQCACAPLPLLTEELALGLLEDPEQAAAGASDDRRRCGADTEGGRAGGRYGLVGGDEARLIVTDADGGTNYKP